MSNILNENCSPNPADHISYLLLLKVYMEVSIGHMPNLADLSKPHTPISNPFHLQWTNATDDKCLDKHLLALERGKGLEEA